MRQPGKRLENTDAVFVPMEGARLGRDGQGNQAWFVPDPDRPGKFLKLNVRSGANA